MPLVVAPAAYCLERPNQPMDKTLERGPASVSWEVLKISATVSETTCYGVSVLEIIGLSMNQSGKLGHFYLCLSKYCLFPFY